MKKDDIMDLLKQGENEYIEFKRPEILSKKFELAREMVALANHSGGYILIGVNDEGKIVGVEKKKRHMEHIINMAQERLHLSRSYNKNCKTLHAGCAI